jgi:predicted nucleic-acid-binding protein
MKAIDTNVLVRFLVNDDPAQAGLVHRRFAIAEQHHEVFFVPLLVIMETIWVLESAYDVGRSELLAALGNLLLLPILEFENRTALQNMLTGAAKSATDLSDLLILETARSAGCEALLTFDKKAAKAAGFELVA